ncbi:MAG: serine hydrolase domain-containing protein [Promethearchaeota archaeon]|jgi:CubicO group peptidase (beta-lactamase class C family)
MNALNIDGGIIGDSEYLGVSQKGLEDVIDVLKNQTINGLHSGVQLHIARKGITVLDIAMGEARPGVPMKTDSVLLIYSDTKPITAMAIAQFWEKGKLHLNSTVKSIIPEFDGGKETCTIRNILIHTAGFPMNDYSFKGKNSNEDFLNDIYNHKAEFKPGTQCSYHPSSSWMILGEIVRRIDGRLMRNYLKEEIFIPLGMYETTLGLTEERIAEVGDKLALKDSKLPEDEPQVRWVNVTNAPTKIFLPGGSGYSTATDMGIFYKALWNGGEWEGNRIVKKKTLDYFTATNLTGIIDQTFRTYTIKGYGFHKGKAIGLRCSPRAFGHGGRRTCMNFCDPELDLIVNFNSNTLLSDNNHNKRLQEMINVIYEACRFNFR